jgi:hypothetical protein
MDIDMGGVIMDIWNVILTKKTMAERMESILPTKDSRRFQFRRSDNSTLAELIPEAKTFSPKILFGNHTADEYLSPKSRTELQRDCLDAFARQCKLNLAWHKMSSKVSTKTHYIKNAVYKVEQATKKMSCDLDKFMIEIESLSGKSISTHDTIASVSQRLVSFGRLIKKGIELSQTRVDIQSRYIAIYQSLPDIQSPMIMKDKSKRYQLDRLKIFECEEHRLEHIVKLNQDQLQEYDAFIKDCESMEAEIFHATQYVQLLHYEVNYMNDHFKNEHCFQYTASELKESTENLLKEEPSSVDNSNPECSYQSSNEDLSVKSEQGTIILTPTVNC